MKVPIRALMATFLCICVQLPAQAQYSSQSPALSGFRRSFATIMFCGLGGAVLGLSTLSFYGKPEDHIGNISTGFAVGILGGVVIATADTTQSARRVESFSLHDGASAKKITQIKRSDAIVVPVLITDF
jgi:hypothetical protein